MKKKIQLLIIALATLLQPAFSQLSKKKVLFVVTSTESIKTTGDKTGIWLEEFATPYYLLKDQGITLTIASPRGGKAPIDPRSTEPDFRSKPVERFLADPATQKVLNTTVLLTSIDPKNYDAVFYPGGHGPMWDLPENNTSIRLFSSFYNAGKPIAFVCHGPAALKNVKTAQGQLLLKGKKVTGYANSEEIAGKTKKFIPFSLEDMLLKAGANYIKGPDWQPFAINDGLLITGQNPASAQVTAEKLLTALQSGK